MGFLCLDPLLQRTIRADFAANENGLRAHGAVYRVPARRGPDAHHRKLSDGFKPASGSLPVFTERRVLVLALCLSGASQKRRGRSVLPPHSQTVSEAPSLLRSNRIQNNPRPS